MLLSDFDFDLPEEAIALRPAPRGSARLLVVRPGQGLEDRRVGDLAALLRPGDALVFNDTRVIPARLAGLRFREGSTVRVEATLLKRLDADRWSALMRPGKRLKPGDRIRFGASAETCERTGFDAEVAGKGEDGEIELKFALSGPALDEAIRDLGDMPLPPYIASKRAEDEADRRDYQTVYARDEGSVAAPTAGLHFTPELIDALRQKGVSTHFVTLHVGAGTFLPVKVANVSEHRMHAEWGVVPDAVAQALNAVKANGGRIVCVGTTSLRLLESATNEAGRIHAFSGETAIFITPGYRFRAADVLMTNFHLPRSTLFMLVSAFAGVESMKAAYAHAVSRGYRFYSYGDSSLLFRAA
ncbi:MAG: tRNA preQ1(34) S-adenosylmethionine ribosyltransferase-isomerase QueA [Caulobacteraceae bacterium]|nr:tRNA preQ1(34) S-adenosylmethionine ribosyltransferase-isomerase QueA [Caulobacteraceae bacterium]